METLSAFAMGELNRDKELMVFDWEKAATLIKEKLHDKIVCAGLLGDLEYTGGVIFADGKPVTDEYTYLSSTWATPILYYYNGRDNKSRVYYDCYIMEHETEWTCDTKWPQSALDILEKESE